MYACMYVCMHVCMYDCMYLYLYVCVYVCMHVLNSSICATKSVPGRTTENTAKARHQSHKCNAPHKARHQSQPSAISATPATQSNNPCHEVPRLPHKVKVDVTKCHACHVKRRWMSPRLPRQQPRRPRRHA